MLWCFANVLTSRDTKRYHKAWRRGALDVLLYPLAPHRRAHIYRDMVVKRGRLFADMTEGGGIIADALRIPTLAVAARRDRALQAAMARRISERYSASPVPTVFKEYRDSGHRLLDDADSATLWSTGLRSPFSRKAQSIRSRRRLFGRGILPAIRHHHLSADWTCVARASKRLSPPGLPINCAPIGKPLASLLTGNVTTGQPRTVSGSVKWVRASK